VPRAALVERAPGRLVLSLPDVKEAALADVLEAVEAAQRDASLRLGEFSLAQAGLERAFLSIVRGAGGGA
jgi:hypothetical protein